MISIHIFENDDREEVIQLVLHCQNDGSRPIVSIEDQTDLLDITNKYLLSGGCFWVAKDNKKVVGSIGLMNGRNGIGILKKFFVYEPYRGTPCHLGQKLYAALLAFARQQQYHKIILETPKNTVRAHIFYLKAGFTKLKEHDLPLKYSTPYKMDENDYFLLDLY